MGTVTELHVYDFDGTTFRSPPEPAVWNGGWWNDVRSLSYPCVPDHPDADWWVASTVQSAKESIANPDVYAILMTGRPERSAFRFRVPELLHQRGLRFDRVYLTDDPDTLVFKKRTLKALLVRHHHIEGVRIWDDRRHHAEALADLAEKMGIPRENIHVTVVRARAHELDCSDLEGAPTPPKDPKYLAVFLDSQSKAALVHDFPAKHPDTYAEHMTIVLKPGHEHLQMIGQVVTMKVVGYAEDEKGQAVLVRPDLPGVKDNPHVTLSVADGVKPMYSNELLSKGWEPVSGPTLRGVVDTFPRSLTPIQRVAARYMAATALPTLEELKPFKDTGECYEWAELVAKKLKKYKLKKVTGAYIKGKKYMDHAWVVAPDGTIIDTTHGQFDRKVPILIASPGTPEHKRYLSSDDMSPEQLEATYGPA